MRAETSRRKPGPHMVHSWLLPAWLFLLAIVFFNQNASASAVVRESLEPNVCAALQGGRLLYLECRLPHGDSAMPFLQRFLSDPKEWEKYRGRSAVAIRFDVLKPEVKRAMLLAIFKKDVVNADGWWHTVMFGGEEGLETLWSFCEWVTGRGTNYRSVMADPHNKHLQTVGLKPGERILIPAALLLDAMKVFTPAPHAANGLNGDDELIDLEPLDLEAVTKELTYGSDKHGAYAEYRLQEGEALYTAVAVRFTDFRDNADILKACETIRQRSGVRDVCSMKPGQKILIPLDMLSDRFLPEGSEQRRNYEETLAEAKRLRKEVSRTKDLEGVVVVLDSGHGGRDHGAPNTACGLYEDELNYDVSCRIKALLETTTRAKVYMTLKDPSQGYAVTSQRSFAHDTDEVLLTTPAYPNHDAKTSAYLRSYIANAIYRDEIRKGTDPRRIVFTSVHTDALYNAKLRGAMIYIPGAQYRRDRERPSRTVLARYEEVKEQPTFTSTSAERRRDEALSRNFAEDLIQSLGTHRIRRHLEGPWIRAQIRQSGGQVYVPAVLRNTIIPTKILVEMANMTNATDCVRLANPEWRQMFAEAYVDALRTYYGS